MYSYRLSVPVFVKMTAAYSAASLISREHKARWSFYQLMFQMLQVAQNFDVETSCLSGMFEGGEKPPTHHPHQYLLCYPPSCCTAGCTWGFAFYTVLILVSMSFSPTHLLSRNYGSYRDTSDPYNFSYWNKNVLQVMFCIAMFSVSTEIDLLEQGLLWSKTN